MDGVDRLERNFTGCGAQACSSNRVAPDRTAKGVDECLDVAKFFVQNLLIGEVILDGARRHRSGAAAVRRSPTGSAPRRCCRSCPNQLASFADVFENLRLDSRSNASRGTRPPAAGQTRRSYLSGRSRYRS